MEFECTLEKRARGKSSFSRIKSLWATRRFVLSGQALSYFDGQTLKGAISIAGCTVEIMNKSDADGKQFAFVLEKGPEKFLLNAENEAQRLDCMQKFQAASVNPDWCGNIVHNIVVANPIRRMITCPKMHNMNLVQSVSSSSDSPSPVIIVCSTCDAVIGADHWFCPVCKEDYCTTCFPKLDDGSPRAIASVPENAIAKECRMRLTAIASKPGNTLCADCSAPDPKWASINNRVFICTKCSGIHRSLGVEKSFVQSLKLDDWKHAQVDMFENDLGDTTASINAAVLEYHVPEGVLKPHANSSHEIKSAFINAKYSGAFARSELQLDPRPPITDTSVETKTQSIGEKEFLGVLMLNLKSATNLINADTFDLSDPYVIAKLGSQTVKSKTINNCLNPVWNETLMLCWDGKDKLILEVWDADLYKSDDPIGNITVDLDSISLEDDITKVLDLSLKDVKHGSLQIEITFQNLGH